MALSSVNGTIIWFPEQTLQFKMKFVCDDRIGITMPCWVVQSWTHRSRWRNTSWMYLVGWHGHGKILPGAEQGQEVRLLYAQTMLPWRFNTAGNCCTMGVINKGHPWTEYLQAPIDPMPFITGTGEVSNLWFQAHYVETPGAIWGRGRSHMYSTASPKYSLTPNTLRRIGVRNLRTG